MRIGYDASPIRPRPSGIGHYAASLLDALRLQSAGNEYLVLTHLGGACLQGSGLTPTQRFSFPVKEIWMQLWLPRILARRRPDLCHFTNHIAPWRTGFPYVVSVHDLSLIEHPEWHPRTRLLWMRRMLRPSVLGARGVICFAEITRQAVIAWASLDPARVWVTPLAARPGFFRSCTEAERVSVRSRYGLRRPFILYVGNIEPRKNLPMLLDAYRQLGAADLDLAVAGRAAWLAGDFFRQVRNAAFDAQVHVLGYVPEEVLPALYQSAVAFVYPSRMEGFGLPVLEAMAGGVPVLTSRIEPLTSLIGDAGWLADPADLREWVSALREIRGEPTRRRSQAERGRERASEFSWSKTAQATIQCYEAALRSGQK